MKFSDVDESSADERFPKEFSDNDLIPHRVVTRIPSHRSKIGTPSSAGSSPERETKTNQFQYSDDDDEPTPRSSLDNEHQHQQVSSSPPSSRLTSGMNNLYMSPPRHRQFRGEEEVYQMNPSYTDPSISASLSGGSDSSTPSRHRNNSQSSTPPLSLPLTHEMIPRPHSISLVSPSRPPPPMNMKLLSPSVHSTLQRTESPGTYSPYSAANISPPYPTYTHSISRPNPLPSAQSELVLSPTRVGDSSLTHFEFIASDASAPLVEEMDEDEVSTAMTTLPWPWIQYFTEEGWPYYFNQDTQESSWDYPDPDTSLQGENILDSTERLPLSISKWIPFQESHDQRQQEKQQEHRHHYEISDDSDLSSCTSVDIKTDTNSVFSRSAASTSGMIEQKNKQGQSVLHISASSGNVEALTLLVSQPSTKPHSFDSPLSPLLSSVSSPQVSTRIFSMEVAPLLCILFVVPSPPETKLPASTLLCLLTPMSTSKTALATLRFTHCSFGMLPQGTLMRSPITFGPCKSIKDNPSMLSYRVRVPILQLICQLQIMMVNNLFILLQQEAYSAVCNFC
jgi:hypothetical protein